MVHAIGLVILVIGFIPFLVAYIKPIHDPRKFGLCFLAMCLVSGAGFILLWV